MIPLQPWVGTSHGPVKARETIRATSHMLSNMNYLTRYEIRLPKCLGQCDPTCPPACIVFHKTVS
jgi:hypothetical protein